MSKNRRGMLSNGITSIVMIFMLLCLITFAVLALVSARADLKYSEQTADRRKAYYEAELRANQKLKDIDADLLEQYNRGEMIGGEQICFSEVIDEVSVLEVELRVCNPHEEGGELYKIERWQTVSGKEWEPDMTLPVMQK